MNHDFICDSDQPNTCPHDGTRTELIEALPDYSLEQCPTCSQAFKFYNQGADE
jgi:predicted nucleic acid-binding Zn ribbon protein